MQNRSPKSLAIFVMTVLVLVPVFQALPLNLPPLLPEASAQGSIALLGTSSLANGTTDASHKITIPMFNVGTGSSRLLVVAVQASGAFVNSITFDGSKVALPLTQASGSFQNDYTAFWYLRNPVGSGIVTITMSGAANVIAGAYSFSGVDQANPIPTTVTNFTQSSSPVQPNPTISITTKYSNSTVLDSAALFGGSKLSGTGCGINEWSGHDPSRTVTGASSYKTQASAGTVTCKWTNSASGNGWDDTAIEIKAAGIDNQVTPITLTSKSTASGFVPRASSSVTLYNFNPGSGANRLLVVGVAADTQFVKASGITFGGVALTKRVSSFLNNDAELWYLKNPSSTPANLVVTMNGDSFHLSQFVIGAYAFSGVNQTSPITNTAAKNNTAVSSPTITITTRNANDWVVDQPSIYGGSTLSSPKCLQQWNSNVQYNSTNSITGASSSLLVPTARTVTCSWTASTAEFWDDVAVDIHAVSLPTSTGILEPLYNGPYNSTNKDGTPCSHAYCFAWDPVNTTKLQHPNVPLFAIVNPNSGPCYTGSGNTCGYNRDFSNGIGNLTRDGVIVLGYAFTGNADPLYDVSRHCCPYTTPKGNVTEWANMYGPQNSTFASKGIKGIFYDQMDPTGVGVASVNLDYYQNLTNYTKSLGFTYTIGNPGTQLEPHFSSSGAADVLTIFENGFLPTTTDLSQNTFAFNGSGFDKHDFSFLAYHICTIPSSDTIGFQSNFTSLMYYTDRGDNPPGSFCSSPGVGQWDKPATYLTQLANILDKPTAEITINSTNLSGKPITGFLVKVSTIDGTLIPSGYTPYTFLGQVNHKYIVTPQGHAGCNFKNWASGGSQAKTITVNSTSSALTVVYDGTCP